jgi:hypothetical protein
VEVVERKGPKLHKKARWQPKKWDPLYDQMVALSCTGLSNKAIADRFQYTPQQVCNILTSDQAKIVKQLITEHIRKVASEDSAARLTRLEHAALKNVDFVLTNEELMQKSPLAIYDRSMAFLKGIGKMEGDKPQVQQTTNVIIADDIAEKLLKGIEKANEAAILHSGNGVEVRALPKGQ